MKSRDHYFLLIQPDFYRAAHYIYSYSQQHRIIIENGNKKKLTIHRVETNNFNPNIQQKN
jgi:hypothetical protein